MSQRSRVTIVPQAQLLVVLIAVVTACEQPAALGTSDAARREALLNTPIRLGRPLPLLTLDQRRLFQRGGAVFQTVFTPETGLGPLFNARSCSGCHEDPVVGGGGTNDPTEEEEDVEVHATAFAGGVCNDLSDQGGPVFQKQVTPALHDALGIDGEPLPAEDKATAIAHRTTPDLLGFGLLDAVPDEEILSHADPEDRDHDGVSGRPNRTAGERLGRFGRKAQEATLREFNAGAFVIEMGITNPLKPEEQTVGGRPLPAGVDPTADPEIGQEAVDAADAFVRFLAPPTPPRLDFVGRRGRVIFSRIGCATCHVPALRTGYNPVRALSYKVVYAYSDLLLHDMGPELADICLGLAEPSEFRTEPLMGLGAVTAFLHDGRAATIEEAIELHGGEAAAARDRFTGLSPRQRAALLRFLNGL